MFFERTLTLHYNNISPSLTVQGNDKIVFLFSWKVKRSPQVEHNSTGPFPSPSACSTHPDMAHGLMRPCWNTTHPLCPGLHLPKTWATPLPPGTPRASNAWYQFAQVRTIEEILISWSTTTAQARRSDTYRRNTGNSARLWRREPVWTQIPSWPSQ